ncbi:acyclic terpene utilization AtuA family protein [Collimonas sp.]|uniref:acyclic terpene utilization AtuA family protein n=1 Tax=Collimonas sp. TaxID=1963772 RepID=UPI002D1D7CFA|nr:acyclic terpene utilization AtuA family protein [Collimonas sp.]HWX01506.1 acyclic terpene utilization AtuA family protein [Collimonas sp.]
MRPIRIGAGAGYSGDRIEPAVELAEKGELDYLVFECLAERTIAIAQQTRMHNPALGYDPLLEQRMQAVLRICSEKKIKIITNMGAANPLAAAARVRQIAADMQLDLKVAAITGDDVLETLKAGAYVSDQGHPVNALADRLLSANAYLGAAPLAEALAQGADVIVTGRVADPSLFLAPLIHEFGWAMDDWQRLGQGTLVGHLLECAGQISGGYFADPGCKDVAGLARLGFPIGEVAQDGSVVITKVAGSGGQVTAATCKEQLLYEIHDPGAYLTPDVVADFSAVRVTEIGPDRVLLQGASGRARTDTLKVSIGYIDSYIGEGQISYAGPGALERGRLALEIVAQRLQLSGVGFDEIRYDLLGVDAIHGAALSAQAAPPYEVRVRVSARCSNLRDATRIGNEVETLYTCGPAAGGGVTRAAREVVAVQSTLLPRQLVQGAIHFTEA